jgi:hypothetical protein
MFTTVLRRPGLTEAVVLAVVDAARHVPSASEQREIYRSALVLPVAGDNVLAAVLEGVPHMNSSSEQGLVMRTIAARRVLSPRVREAYLRAANAISSDSERASVLAELLGDRQAAASPGSGARSVQVDGTVEEHLWNAEVEVTEHDGRVARIFAKNVEFGRQRWDITRIRRGGRLVVEERARGRSRRLEITPDADGGLRHSYRVDGEARPFNTEGENWMIAIIRELTDG